MKKFDLVAKEIYKKIDPQEGIRSANILLERIPEQGYLQEWTLHLMKEKQAPLNATEHSVVIFRIKGEWLALSTLVFKQVCESRIIHRVPHKDSRLLLGLVNIEGQIRMCVALNRLLEIEDQAEKTIESEAFNRFIVVDKEGEIWVFPVDEVFGIFHCYPDQITNLPVTLAKSSSNYLKGVFSWDKGNVGYLDEELLFYTLKRKIA